jgi:ABC-2 type transport system ATP-binding protein
MVKIEKLKKSYIGKVVLQIESLNIEKGEILGVVGNNGAGKTTLFRLILDLISADQGEVKIDSMSVSKTGDWKAFTGSYLDESFLIDYLSPEEFFIFMGKIYGLSKEEVFIILDSLKLFFGGEILNQKRKYIREFSSGNRQKIGIASAIFFNPRLVILDEPFNHLDPTSQSIIKDILINLNRNFGSTILISSHNLNHVCDMCHRIIILQNGQVVEDCKNNSQFCNLLNSYFSTPNTM